MERLKPLSVEDLPASSHDVVKSGMNLHKILVHSPATARVSRQVGLYLRNDCTLDGRLRELAIIQVAYTAGSAYEYTHHLKIAERMGIPEADLLAIAQESRGVPSGLDRAAQLVLRAAREMSTRQAVQDDTFAALAGVLSSEHIVDLAFAIAFYCGFVRLTGTLGVALEPDYAAYLERFPLAPADV